MANRVRLLLALIFCSVASFATADGEAVWSAKLDRPDVRVGEIARVVMTAKLKEGWHAYSIVEVPGGPFPTTISTPTGDGIQSVGPPEERAPHVQFDANFQKQVGTFEGSAEFYAPIRIIRGPGAQKLTASLRYEVCNAQNCLPPASVELPVTFSVQPGPARTELTKFVPMKTDSAPPAQQTKQAPLDETAAQIKKAENSGLLSLIVLAFGCGLLSLLTPCVFPMIPITVSFFSKQRPEGERLSFAGPIAYCLGIIGTFTGLGVIVGSTGLNKIATNVWVNLALGVLFIVLAASLFGVFEIRLPGWLINKASAKSRSGGLIGAYLMGLTFTLTSFTCTVPFVGTFLLTTSAEGGLTNAIVGMLAYSTAFALPFFLLALFPSFLSRLPRSGAWLVTVKAYMGFLELMAALKFLSNADLAMHLAWLTKPAFLAIWAATAAIGGFYLLGCLRLPHDVDTKIGWLRRGLGVATMALAVLCIAGIDGVKLKTLESFFPPDPYPGQLGQKGRLTWESTYEAALSRAKASNKNVFIDFTGIYCTNCRDIEANVFTQPEVEGVLQKFVLARLFTDDGSPADDANQKLEVQMAKVNTLPLYAVVSPDGKVLKIHQQQPPLEDKDQFLNAIRPYSSTALARN